MDGEKRGKYRSKYTNGELHHAAQKVLQDGWTIYKSAKEYKVPYNTLKDYVVSHPVSEVPTSPVKLGKPFALTSDEELKLVQYIIKMQELGFGLSATDVRNYAYKIASRGNRQHPFSNDESLAGWKWWHGFKNRYGFSMRLPENISINRAYAAKRETMNQFFEVLNAILKKHNLFDKPHLIWNLDEAGFNLVPKPSKIVSPKGSKRIFQQATGERGETTTALLAVNASGQVGPCLLIFKGLRDVPDDVKSKAPPNAMVTVSKNGWTNSEIFYNFFHHLIKTLPSARPILLLMDSHVSHISPDTLTLASENDIIFLTFPSHTTNLLQPLDVAVFGPMKTLWKKEVKKLLQSCGYKPSRKDFMDTFSYVFLKSVTMANICSGFRKTGIYPYNKEAISDEDLKISKSLVPATPVPDSLNEDRAIKKVSPKKTAASTLSLSPILPLPKPIEKLQKRRSNAAVARLFENSRPTDDQPSISGVQVVKKKRSSKMPKPRDDICSSCGVAYEGDTKGGNWIQCLKCLCWFHYKCQSLKKYEPNFNCKMCITENDSD